MPLAAISWANQLETVDEVGKELSLVVQLLAMGGDEGLWRDGSNSLSGHHVGFGEDVTPSDAVVSEWILERICEVSRLLGVSFKGHETEAI
ncbi:hypothetical protein LOK49_LG05G00431 [Camellia lanceoleosa]|uniref:Uncharacterized protein n=1 Tax=Camellia lanceoleosa TaxID=1840588 RepID=A0ACC0HWG1_9ERIC|nr:hypothetical protein LOK49_LG05G00431 [Camellia lanceoleosa]